MLEDADVLVHKGEEPLDELPSAALPRSRRQHHDAEGQRLGHDRQQQARARPMLPQLEADARSGRVFTPVVFPPTGALKLELAAPAPDRPEERFGSLLLSSIGGRDDTEHVVSPTTLLDLYATYCSTEGTLEKRRADLVGLYKEHLDLYEREHGEHEVEHQDRAFHQGLDLDVVTDGVARQLNWKWIHVSPMRYAQWMASTICDLVAQTLMRVAVGNDRYFKALKEYSKLKRSGDAAVLSRHGPDAKVTWINFKAANAPFSAETCLPVDVACMPASAPTCCDGLYCSHPTKTCTSLHYALKNAVETWASREGRGVAQVKFNPNGDWHTFVIERVAKDELHVFQGYQGHYPLYAQARDLDGNKAVPTNPKEIMARQAVLQIEHKKRAAFEKLKRRGVHDDPEQKMAVMGKMYEAELAALRQEYQAQTAMHEHFGGAHKVATADLARLLTESIAKEDAEALYGVPLKKDQKIKQAILIEFELEFEFPAGIGLAVNHHQELLEKGVAEYPEGEPSMPYTARWKTGYDYSARLVSWGQSKEVVHLELRMPDWAREEAVQVEVDAVRLEAEADQDLVAHILHVSVLSGLSYVPLLSGRLAQQPLQTADNQFKLNWWPDTDRRLCIALAKHDDTRAGPLFAWLTVGGQAVGTSDPPGLVDGQASGSV